MNNYELGQLLLIEFFEKPSIIAKIINIITETNWSFVHQEIYLSSELKDVSMLKIPFNVLDDPLLQFSIILNSWEPYDRIISIKPIPQYKSFHQKLLDILK